MPQPRQSRSRRSDPPPEDDRESLDPDEPRPRPSQSQSQSEPGEGSWASSGPASSAVELLADPGPAFDAEDAPDAPEPERDELLPFEEWDTERIQELLELKGEVLHAFLNAGPEDADTWLYTQKDLRAIAPPLTRILNRYDATRAAAAAGDEILLASGIARYAGRNYVKRRRYLAAARAAGPQPVTGREAPPDTEPEGDEEWRGNELEVIQPPAIVPKGTRR